MGCVNRVEVIPSIEENYVQKFVESYVLPIQLLY